MKNIHILPTDKPSRLIIYSTLLNEFRFLNEPTEDWKHKRHIYITSDDEIREDDWYITQDGKPKREIFNLKRKGRVILTTNTSLIADGVQAIDDEFLEWFVKNPSCEEVLVQKWYSDFTVDPFVGYKIIIPQGDVNFFQITVNAFEKSMNLNLEYIEEPKQETLEEYATRCDEYSSQLEKETLEEVAEREAEKYYNETFKSE
jgi:hypothetical protein